MRASGVTFGALEAKFGVPKTVLLRHWHDHVGADRRLTYLVGKTTIQEIRERAVEENLSVLDYLAILRSGLMGQFVHQCEADAAIGAANVAGRVLDVLQQIGRITGEVAAAAAPGTVINNTIGISAAPAFPALMDGLLRICRVHPEARADIIALIDELGGAPAPQRWPVAAIEREAANV